MTDANTTIFRKTNESDKEYIDVDLNERKVSFKDKFIKELHAQEAKAHNKKLPFARNAARNDWNDELEANKKQVTRGASTRIEIPQLEWKHYSDLKNFTLVEEKERPAPEISKHNPGLHVRLKTKVYKWKQSNEKCTVMEDPEDALRRAQEVVRKQRT